MRRVFGAWRRVIRREDVRAVRKAVSWEALMKAWGMPWGFINVIAPWGVVSVGLSGVEGEVFRDTTGVVY